MIEARAPTARGEIEALTALDNKFRRSLLRYFGRRFSKACEIEDMVQEVFVRLVRRAGVGNLENPQAYVFETASSVLKDRLRKMRTRHEVFHEPFRPDHHEGADFSPEDVLLARERLSNATAALLELPERTRVIFTLRRLEGLRFQDIAARLDISVSAVEKHMQRAMSHLMRRCDPK